MSLFTSIVRNGLSEVQEKQLNFPYFVANKFGICRQHEDNVVILFQTRLINFLMFQTLSTNNSFVCTKKSFLFLLNYKSYINFLC